MLRSLTPLRVACLLIFLLPIVAAASNDPGIPDTVALELADLSATAGDSVFAVEVWLFNDSLVRAVAIPIRWENGDVRLDSATTSAEFSEAFDPIRGVYYGGSVSLSNEHNILRLGGQSLYAHEGLQGMPVRRSIATYYFTDTAGTQRDSLSFVRLDSVGNGVLTYNLVATGSRGYKPCFLGINAEPYYGEGPTDVLGLSNTEAYPGSMLLTTILTTDSYFSRHPVTDRNGFWLSSGIDSIPLIPVRVIDHNVMEVRSFIPDDMPTGPLDLHYRPFRDSEEKVLSAAAYVAERPGYPPPVHLSPDRIIQYLRYPNVTMQTELLLDSAVTGYLLDGSRIADSFGMSHPSSNSIEFEIYGRLIEDWKVDSSKLTVALYDSNNRLVYQADDAIHCNRFPRISAVDVDTIYYRDTTEATITIDFPWTSLLEFRECTVTDVEIWDFCLTFVDQNGSAISDSQYTVSLRPMYGGCEHEPKEQTYDLTMILNFQDMPQEIYYDFSVTILNGHRPPDRGVIIMPPDSLKRDSVVNDIPTSFALGQNYPNPFNPETHISYDLPEAGDVRIDLFNILGQKVATLLNEFQVAGRHEVSFNPQNQGNPMASGVYFYRIVAGSFTESRQMVYLK